MPEIGALFLCGYCKNREGKIGCKLVRRGVITRKEQEQYMSFECPYFIPNSEWKKKYGKKTPEEVLDDMLISLSKIMKKP